MHHYPSHLSFVCCFTVFLSLISINNGFKITRSLGSQTGEKGSNISLICSFSNPPSIVTWYFSSGVKLVPLIRCDSSTCTRQSGFEHYTEVSGSPHGILYFTGLHERNDGAYQCEAFYEVESARSDGQLSVLAPPTVPIVSSDSTFGTENTSLTLTCSVKGANPLPTVVWYKRRVDGVFQTVLDPTSVVKEGKFGWYNSSVTLMPDRADNQGMVQCKALHSLLNISSNDFILNIHYKPHISPLSPVKVILGSSVTLQCSATGNPTPHVYFSKDSSIFSGKSLSAISHPVPSVSADFQGHVTCNAENSVTTVKSPFLLDVLTPPVVQTSSTFVSREGSRFEVPCKVTGNPLPKKVTWSHVRSGRVVTVDGPGFGLLIDSVRRVDGGKWRCTAESVLVPSTGPPETKTAFGETELIVEYLPGSPTISVSRTRIIAGDNVTLLCQSNLESPGIPAPLFLWSKGSFTSTGQVLALHNVSVLNSGDYMCTPQNNVGMGISATASLNVELPPYWSEPLSSGPISIPIERTDFFISCVVNAKPQAEITWFKKGKPLTEGLYTIENSAVFKSGAYFEVKSILLFKGVSRLSLQPEDSASFECDAKNEHGKITKQTKVIVIFKPVILNNDTKIAVSDNLKANIMCDFLAQPVATVTWYFNDSPLVEGSVISDTTIEYKHWSILGGVKDLGKYTCHVTNSQGTLSKTFLLVNQSVPEQPTRLRIISYEWDHVQLAWQAGFSGGQPAQYWLLLRQFDDNGRQIDLLTQKAPFPDYANVTNLLPNYNYTIEVYAVNSLGQGPKSVTVSLRTKYLALPKPTRVYFSNDGSLMVDAISGYCLRIEQSKDSGKSWTLYHFCVPSENGQLAGVSLTSVYRVSLCLLQRSQVCGPTVLLTSSISLADIPITTLIIVGCCCGTVILALIFVLVFFCCKRPRQFKEPNSALRRPNSLKPSNYQNNTLSQNKPLAMVSPSFSADNLRSSFCDIKDIEDGNEVFATLRSANLPLQYARSNSSFREHNPELSDANQNRSMQTLYFEKPNKKVVYEVVV